MKPHLCWELVNKQLWTAWGCFRFAYSCIFIDPGIVKKRCSEAPLVIIWAFVTDRRALLCFLLLVLFNVCVGVWDKVLGSVAERRAETGMLRLFPIYLKGEDLFGLTVSAVTRIAESVSNTTTKNNDSIILSKAFHVIWMHMNMYIWWNKISWMDICERILT